MAAHYGDAPDDFVVADNVELPWPSAQGGMEWEWRVMSLRDIFPELSASRTEGLGRRRSLEDGRMPKEVPGLRRVNSSAETGRGDTETSHRGAVVRQETGRGQPPMGERGSRVPPWPSRPLRGAQGLSGEVAAGGMATSSTSMLSPPPPPFGDLPLAN